MADKTDAEKEAYAQYQAAKRVKDYLKKDIGYGTRTKAENIKTVDELWHHVQDFIPRHWRDESVAVTEK